MSLYSTIKKNYLTRLRTNGQEKAPDKNRGDATFIPYFSSRDMERKPGVAGGSKWTYEATFRIAMKIGRKYPSTAANALTCLFRASLNKQKKLYNIGTWWLCSHPLHPLVSQVKKCAIFHRGFLRKMLVLYISYQMLLLA